jgi:hypothetical protein
MTDHKSDSHAFNDLERPHPVVADSLGGPEAAPFAVRLGDLWSDFIRASDQARESGAPRKPGYSLPLLDEMRGIHQWD